VEVSQAVNLDKALPQGDVSGSWSPQGIIYCKVTMTLINGSWTIKYLAPTPVMVANTNVPAFIAQLNGDRAALQAKAANLQAAILEGPVAVRASSPLTAPILNFIPSPLDFAIPEDCYVLFELEEGDNWQFDGDIITTKADCAGRYFDLNTAQDGAGSLCYAYFSAKFDTGAQAAGVVNNDLFNMYLRFFEGTSGALGIRVDPDIKNPGDDVRPLLAKIAVSAARFRKMEAA
jgi:hypothetical protein